MRALPAVVRKPLHKGRRVDVFEEGRKAHVTVELVAQIPTGPASWRCAALSLETFGVTIASFDWVVCLTVRRADSELHGSQTRRQ